MVFLSFKKVVNWSLVLSVLVVGLFSMFYFYQQSGQVDQKFEPIFQGDGEKKEIAFICNVVWGEEFLPEMLEVLADKEVKMTFFVGGQWAEKNADLLKTMSEQGHEIANHGYQHLHPTKISKRKNFEELEKTRKILKEITGSDSNLFHPPYRDFNDWSVRVAGEAGYITILSSIDTIDWQRPAPNVIVERVVSKAHNGGIVLMHPTAPTTQALGTMIDKLENQGYKLVTISDLLDLHRQNN